MHTHNIVLEDRLSWLAWDDDAGQWARDDGPAPTPVVGKIVTMDGEKMCLVRRVSDRTLTAELSDTLTPGDMVSVEAESLFPTDAVVHWAKDGLVGLQFLVSQSEALAVQRNRIPGFPLRGPRFSLIEPARIHIGQVPFHVRTLDISDSGAKIDVSRITGLTRSDTPFAAGAMGWLTIRGMHEARPGHVRWCSREKMGFQFQDRIPMDALQRIMSTPLARYAP